MHRAGRRKVHPWRRLKAQWVVLLKRHRLALTVVEQWRAATGARYSGDMRGDLAGAPRVLHRIGKLFHKSQ